MANPLFITVLKTGDVYVSCDLNYAPPAAAGVVAAVWKVNSSASSQKIGTITGAGSPNYSCSGDIGNKHTGKETV